MLSLARSCFLRMIAFVTIFLPMSMLVAQIWALSPHPPHRAVTLIFSFVKPSESASQPVQSFHQPVQSSELPPVSRRSMSGTSVLGGPSLSPDLINQVLSMAGSPAAGTGQSPYDLE